MSGGLPLEVDGIRSVSTMTHPATSDRHLWMRAQRGRSVHNSYSVSAMSSIVLLDIYFMDRLHDSVQGKVVSMVHWNAWSRQ